MINKTDIILDNKILSSIAFGTHKFEMCDLGKNIELLDTYCNGGGNVIDTGRSYGESEKCIGEWIKQRGEREDLVLITKGCQDDRSTDKVLSRLNPYELEKDITESLKALSTEYIDIYFFHKDDVTVAPEEAIEMLNKYVKMGLVRHIGASNWTAERIDKANQYAKKNGLQQFEFSEFSFSLRPKSTLGWPDMCHVLEMDKKEYEWYKKSNIPVLGFNSQAYGFFYQDLPDYVTSEESRRIYKMLKEICANKGINAQQALFGFYFGCDIKNIPIVTTANIDRLKSIIENCNVVLDKTDVEKLLAERLN